MKCTIHLTQKTKKYLTKVLQLFVMNSNTKLVSTPLAYHFKLSDLLSPCTDEERKYMAHVLYVGLIGSLNGVYSAGHFTRC